MAASEAPITASTSGAPTEEASARRPICLRTSERARDTMGQTQTIHLPPWVPSTEVEKANEVEFREAILKLSTAAANLISPHPLHQDPEFSFDWVEHRPFAEAAYSGDRRLFVLLPKLVPKRISEEEFWYNYFSHVFAVKRRYELGGGDDDGGASDSGGSAGVSAGSAASGTATANGVAEPEDEIVPAVPASPWPMTKTVSYPEKFHMALKYYSEGPPLPNLSDADRILLEALEQSPDTTLPSVFLLGGEKCGSTSLAFALSRHPQVLRHLIGMGFVT